MHACWLGPGGSHVMSLCITFIMPACSSQAHDFNKSIKIVPAALYGFAIWIASQFLTACGRRQPLRQSCHCSITPQLLLPYMWPQTSHRIRGVSRASSQTLGQQHMTPASFPPSLTCRPLPCRYIHCDLSSPGCLHLGYMCCMRVAENSAKCTEEQGSACTCRTHRCTPSLLVSHTPRCSHRQPLQVDQMLQQACMRQLLLQLALRMPERESLWLGMQYMLRAARQAMGLAMLKLGEGRR